MYFYFYSCQGSSSISSLPHSSRIFCSTPIINFRSWLHCHTPYLVASSYYIYCWFLNFADLEILPGCLNLLSSWLFFSHSDCQKEEALGLLTAHHFLLISIIIKQRTVLRSATMSEENNHMIFLFTEFHYLVTFCFSC